MNKPNLLQKHLLSFAFAIVVFFAFPLVVQASTFTVDSTGDGADASIDGLCADSGGKCTLRAAIAEANATAGPHTINFNIPTSDSGYVDYDGGAGDSLAGDDYWTIVPSTALPTITSSGVTINGVTQTSNQFDSNTYGPEIEIRGHTGGEINGFIIDGAGAVFDSIIINRFGSAHSEFLVNAGITVINSYIGMDPKALPISLTDSSARGFTINTSTNTVIGGNTSNRNLIGNHRSYDIFILGGLEVEVSGNYFNLSSDGSTSLNSSVVSVINITGQSDVMIGGDLVNKRNIIAGGSAGQRGIRLDDPSKDTISNLEIYNNFIGSDVTGSLNRGGSSNAVVLVDNGAADYDGAQNTIKIGGENKGNLIRGYSSHGINLGGLIRNIYIGYNTIATFGSGGIINNSSSVSAFNTTLTIENNALGRYAEDPIFGRNLTSACSTFCGLITVGQYQNLVIQNNDILLNVSSDNSTGMAFGFTNNATVQNNNIHSEVDCRSAVKCVGISTHSEGNTQIFDNTIDGFTRCMHVAALYPLSIEGNNLSNCDVGIMVGQLIYTDEANVFEENTFVNVPRTYVSTWFSSVEIFSNNKRRTDLTDAQITIPLPADIPVTDSNGNFVTSLTNYEVTCNVTTNCQTTGTSSGDLNKTEVLMFSGFTVSFFNNPSFGGLLYPRFVESWYESDGTKVEFSTSSNPTKFDLPHLASQEFSFDDHSGTHPVSPDRGEPWTNFPSADRNPATVGTHIFTSIRQVMEAELVDANPVLQLDGSYVITVDSTTDEDNVSTAGYDDGDGAYSGGGSEGPGGVANGKTSLREAIIVANNFAPVAQVKIHFNIPTSDTGYRDYDSPDTSSTGNGLEGDDFWKIIPGTLLPTITNSDTTIDGATQTTNQGDKNIYGPEIQIHGSASTLATGLNTTAANTTINGVIVSLFTTQMQLSGNAGTVTNSYINIDPKGLGTYTVKTNGISIGGVTGTVIGNTTADGNVIGRNTNGINAVCGSSGAKTMAIAGNYIGINKDASYTTIANTNGIIFAGDCVAIVGGDLNTNRNYISGNTTRGIGLDGLSSSAVPKIEFYNNFFGSDPTGILNRANGSFHIGTTVGTNFLSAENQLIIGAEGKGNFFSYTSGRQIWLQASIKKSEISYNTLANSSNQAISLLSPSTGGPMVLDSYIHHNFIGESDSDPYFGLSTNGIEIPIVIVNRVLNVRIENNEMYAGRDETDNSSTGCILMLTASVGGAGIINANIDIKDNVIDGCRRGIQVGMEYISLNIENNTISNNLEDGIEIFFGNGGQIKNNTINKNDLNGIHFHDLAGDGYTLQGNKIYSNNIADSASTEIVNIPSEGSADSHAVILNDAGDADGGKNDQQNWPEITAVEYVGGGQYKVHGRLDGNISEAPFDIEICKSDNHASGHGGCTDSLSIIKTASEPDLVEGSSNWFNWEADVIVDGSNGSDQVVFTSLATNANGSTSQFGTNFDTATNENYTILNYPITLTYPIDGNGITDRTPLLDWTVTGDPDIDHYDVYLNHDSSSSLVKIGEVDEVRTNFQISSEFPLHYRTYYWQVIGIRENGTEGGRSEIESFKVVESLSDLTLLYPIGGVGIDERIPTFTWSESTNPETKYYEIYLTKEGEEEVLLGTIQGKENTTLQPIEDLEFANYSWRVVSYYIDGKISGESVTETFRVIDPESILPPDTGTNENPPVGEDQRTIFEEIRDFLALIPPVLIAAVLSIGIALATGIWFDIFRRTGVFIGALIPKKRKYWGVIYDEVESKGIAFAVVRLIKDGAVKATTVSDIAGRYGLLVDETGEYELTVESSGFKPYKSTITITDANQEIIQDVKMGRIDGKLNVVNRIRFYSKGEAFKVLNIVWTLSMVIGLVITIRASLETPTAINMIIIALYTVILIVNILLLLVLKVRSIGKVVEEGTGSPVDGAVVRFYDQERQLDLAVTNKQGSIKINMKEGNYSIMVYKEGYMQNEESKSVELDRGGHLTKDITIKKSV